jgi:hypothetical protein
MKRIFSLLLVSCICFSAFTALAVPVTGTKTIGVDYVTLASAITDLNTNGISGNVIINIPSGYTETAPAGGYLLGSATLNGSTSATATLTIQKSGATANPLLTAPLGTSTSVDGIFFIQGTDYVTINGIDLAESAANTTATAQMEYGYALVKLQSVAPFDGCQNVTIQNCTITLNISNANTVGIYAGNQTAASTTALTITATTDAMNNCAFRSNTVQNCVSGIWLKGYATAASPYTLYDQNNTIGGGSTAGNTIQNFGGVTAGFGVVLQYQNSDTVTYNTINNTAGGGIAATQGLVGVDVANGTNMSANISNNTFNLTMGTTAQSLYEVYINCAGTGTINVDANTFTASGGSTGVMHMIYFASGNTNINVTNNNFNNINVATTNTLGLIYQLAAASTLNMYCNGNYTSGSAAPYISKTVAGGTFYGYYNAVTSSAGTTTISNNNISNVALTGATTFIGLYESNGNVVNAGIKYVSNNIISNISTGGVSAALNYGIAVGGAAAQSISNCQVSNMNVGIGNGYAIYHWACTTDTIRNCRVNGLTSTGGNIYGITTSNTSTTTRIYGDTVNGLSTTFSTGLAYGIYQSGVATAEIYKNVLYDISASGTSSSVNGIYLNAGINTVWNNLVADLRTPNYTGVANSGTQLVGIYCANATTYNLYYNTVYLNATSTGAVFGSTAVYAATGNATFNNNIFINNSTPSGTGMVAAYRRSTTGLTGFQAASNNNLFYAGTPAANAVIMYDGTTAYQTLAAYKTLVTPRDAASVTENVPFLAVTGGTSNFLKPNTTIATQVESNGINISGFTDDMFGTVRAGNAGYAGTGVAPDLGAVEANYIPLDLSAPSITYTSLTSTCATGNRTVTATITDVTGVPVSGTLMPRIYYKKGSGSWFWSTGALASGTATSGSWNFTIVASDMGGVVGGDNISYFVIAQDGAATPNIGSIPVGVAATDVNTIGTYPATPNTYSINYTLNGSYNVGVGGAFTTITAAANAYTSACLTGPVTFLLTDATYPGETFPIAIGYNALASSAFTLMIRPAAGATPTITGSGFPIFSLDAAQYVTIDGRAGSTGSIKALTISNTTTNSADIRFNLGANYDTIKYCTLLSVNTATNTGTIFFNPSTGVTGNSNNVIDNCDFTPGSTPYVQGIYSSGTTGKENINNTISNCNFADVFSATVATCGINLSTATSGWTITNNKFYQTTAKTYTTANTHRAILISNTAGNGFAVTNNIIGYATAAATGTYSMAGTVTTTFRAIELAVGTTTPSSVQGNTITNMSLSGGTAGIITGIYISAGSVNVGTTTANTIGAATGTGAISVTNTGTANPAFLGINALASSPAVVNIRNNNIGSITAVGPATAGEGIIGILASSSATDTISNNTIGNTVTANSINSSANSTGSAYQVYGISSTLSTAGLISNNTVANLNNAGTSTLAFAAGIIHTGTGAMTIAGNTVMNISGVSGNISILGQTGVSGIVYTGTGTSTIIQNTVNAIMYTGATAVQSNVSGICYASSVNGSILRNRIYDLRNASIMAVNTTPPTATGILIGSAGGTLTTIANNMISIGNLQGTNTEFMGITNSGTATSALQVYYNSINIEGPATGALPTMGFNRGNNTTTAVTTTVDLKNNIIRNVRAGGTGKHYAIVNGLLVVAGSATGWPLNASNYNILNATAANVGFWSTDQTLAGWRTASAGDGNSYSGVAVTFNNTATADLHMNMGTIGNYIESHGTAVAVTNDYDNETRPGPVGSVNGGGVLPDIGADEFDGVSIDDVAPVITYTALTQACTTGDRTLTATIIDQSGVPAAGTGTEPRIYYKRGLAGSWISHPGTLSGTVFNGTWSFSILAADMPGLSPLDNVYYYVTAQDVAATPNIGANPGAGFAATSVTTVTTAPTAPNSYVVNYTSGSFTVGVGQQFATITAAVNSYNANTCLTGPVTFSLMDATYSGSEIFPITINRNPLAGPGVTLTIKPAAGVAALVTSSSSATAVFKLLNAKYVTIDGVNTGGSSLALTNGNAGTNTAVVWLASTLTTGPGNNRISLLNMNMTGGANSPSNLGIVAGVDGASPALSNGMDNDSVTIQGNTVTKCGYAVVGAGTTATAAGGLNGWVINNNIFGPAAYSTTDNLGYNGVFMRNMTTPFLYGNTIQFVGLTTVNAQSVGVYMEAGVDGAILDSNIISTVQATFAGGANTSVCGIYFGSTVINSTASRNKISSINNLHTSGWGARAFTVNTSATSNDNIVNNFISNVTSYSNPTVANSAVGIGLDGTSGGVNIYHNSINLYGTHTGLLTATGTADIFISATGGNIDVRNNILVNSYDNTSSALDKTYAIYSTAANTVFSNIDNNDYYTSGTSPILGNIGGTDRLTLANIVTGFGGNTHSVSGPIAFVSNQDLHIPAGSTNVLESAAAPIASVVTDIDGQVRPGPVGSIHGGGFIPDIGADEFDGVPTDGTAPSITYTALSTPLCATGNRTLTGVSISDASGVPTTGTLMPRIYFKKNTGSWVSDTGTLTSGTALNGIWSFTISATAMGGLSGTDVVSYFVIAQDVATSPNVGASPGAGLTASNVNSVTVAPGTPNTFTITPTLTGDYFVGAGGNYTTITAAVNAYNTACLSGNVRFILTDPTYSASETFPIVIQNNPNASSSNTLTIKPAAVAATITGSTGAAAVFKLLNARYVTIDGLNTGGSSLTVNNSNTGASAVIWLASTVTTGPGNKNISLLNMNMNGGLATNASNYGIIACVDGATPAATNGMDNDSVTIQGNYIKKCGYAIFAAGTTATAAGGLNGWVMRNNILGPWAYSATDNLGVNGMFLRNMTNVVYAGNTMQNVATLVGMYIEAGVDGIVIDSNVVDSVFTTTAPSIAVCAFYLGSGVKNATISRNKISSIYALNATGYGARGITVTNATAASNVTIVNNFISDIISYSSTSVANWVAGIGVDGTSGGVNIYNNSINLFGSHVGLAGATGSADITITTTGTGIDVRNNLLVNTYENTSSVADKTYAIYSTAASTAYTNIDYNDYYTSGGTPMLGYVGGVDRPGLADMIAGFGGNANSINTTAPFVSSMDLHIPLGTASALESAGSAAVPVTTDIDGDVRPGPAGSTHGGGSVPDIGADEFDGIPIDGSAPLIGYTALTATTCSTSDVTLTGVTITDVSGVPTTGILIPRIYFKKTAGAWHSAAGTLTSGTSHNGIWSFTISAAAMGGLIPTDVVAYYVVAQDVAPAPNLGGYPGAGLSATDVNTVTAPPTTPSTYTVTATLHDSYYVGVGGAYTTLTAAVNAYNTACLTAPVTFVLTDATYPSETYPITILANANASATNTLTIKPAPGVAATVTDLATSASVFKLLNAQYVTIDGVNTGGASLTLNNNNTGNNTAVIWLASTATTGPGNKNISLLNMNMVGGIASSTTNWGIASVVDGATPTAANSIDNDSITVQGNSIKKCGYTLWLSGNAATPAGGLNNWVIKNNLLGPTVSSATDNPGVNGTFMANMQNVVFSGNTLQNIGLTTITSAVVGMYFQGGIDGMVIDSNIVNNVVANTTSGFQVCALYFNTGNKNVTISRNKITAMYNVNTGGYGARGIVINNGTAASNFNIVNNFISDVVSYSNTTANLANWAAGISVDGASGGVNIYNNSINLFGAHPGLSSATGSADLLFTSTGTGFDVRNNILVNSYDNTSSTTDKTYAIYSTAANTAFTNIDYNDYYTTGGTPMLGYIGSTDRPALSDVITGFGGNTHSINTQPVFISPTDLHLQVYAANVPLIAGSNLPSVTTDIDGTTRGTPPVIGADEVSIPNCSGTPIAGTVNATPATGCGTYNSVLGLTGAAVLPGVNCQWETSTDNVTFTPISGATSTSYPATISSTIYYRATLTCTISGLSASTTGLPLIYTPYPAAIVGATTMCTGNTTSLTSATGGGTWSSGSPAVATVSSTGVVTGVAVGGANITYTASGCSVSSNIAITPAPTTPIVTNTIPVFCSGGVSTLSATSTNSVTATSGTISVVIPDNNATGAFNSLAVAGIPAGATITSMSVNFNVTMTITSDINLNLTAPNGNTINLVHTRGGSANFTNTKVSSAGTTSMGAASNPYTGTYAADFSTVATVGATAYPVNSTTWASLYSVPNGAWVLSGRDILIGITGTITSWSISITYSMPSSSFVWSPATGLYTDAGLTIPYAGTGVTTVYAAPTATGTASINTYSVVAGCSSTATTTVTVNPLPADIAGTNAVCVGSNTTLTDATTGGTWSSSAAGTATVGSGTGIVNGVAAGGVTMTYANSATGCFKTMQMTVNPLPNAIAGTSSVCGIGYDHTHRRGRRYMVQRRHIDSYCWICYRSGNRRCSRFCSNNIHIAYKL